MHDASRPHATRRDCRSTNVTHFTPPTRRHRARARAFTLLEILIVGALISLFAGLAVIGIQEQFENNLRKATIAETRTIATALDMAYADVGFFPKICFLDDSKEILRFDSDTKLGDPTQVFNFMHNLGVSTTSLTLRITTNWRGPYISPASYRTSTAQGRGGARPMQFNEPGFSGVNSQYDWPLDPYNNPYLLYILDIEPDAGSSLLFASAPGTIRNQEQGVGSPVNSDPNYTGTFVNAVVSYGPNNVPGGGPNFIPNGDPATSTGDWRHRLYRGIPGNSGATPYEYLAPLGFANPEKANIWSSDFGTFADYPLLGDGSATPIGITDVAPDGSGGSDDIVYAF